LGIADYVCTDLLALEPEEIGFKRAELPGGPWWLRAARHRNLA
jgi:hypothetical protein